MTGFSAGRLFGPPAIVPGPVLTPGSVEPIGYAAGAHPQGLPAVLEQISPKYQSWNPLPGTEGPWGRVGVNPIVFGFDKAFSFCGICKILIQKFHDFIARINL